jgi:dephospho-CoA kinase
MLVIGLTGGIGCGKSSVAELLVARGAVLIDADEIAREVVAPGAPGHRALVEHFGRGILAPDGSIDRAAVAARAFNDPKALAELNAITHPIIGFEMRRRRDAVARSDAVVVLAIPLLKAEHRQSVGLDAVVVVDCAPDAALDRLVGGRAMDRADAAARIAAQVPREERREGADFVVDNSGSPEDLVAEVGRLWTWLEERRRAATIPTP